MISGGREFRIGRLKVNTFSVAGWASWLVQTAADIYDTSPGNVNSGLNYENQDHTKPNHIHDIAIRRCLLRLHKWFKGDHLVEIRGLNSEGYTLNPGIVPFHKPEFIHLPEWKANWFTPGSIESFWQSNKVVIISDMIFNRLVLVTD